MKVIFVLSWSYINANQSYWSLRLDVIAIEIILNKFFKQKPNFNFKSIFIIQSNYKLFQISCHL